MDFTIKVSTPERKRSKSRSDFSLESANADTVGFIFDKPRLRSCVDTHCVFKPVRPTGGTNWSEDVNLSYLSRLQL